MLKFWMGRIALAVLVMWLVSVLVFWGSQVLPGDVAQLALGQYATPQAVATLREQMGLNQPAPYRYLLWLIGMLHGDWGVSLVTGTPVAQMLSERAANTGLLAIVTVVIAVPLAIGLGMLMSLGRGRWADRLASVAVLSLAAAPEFLIATIAVLLLAVKLRWLPAISYLTPDSSLGHIARALVLPVMTLVIIVSAQIARMTRAILGNLMSQPFAEMAMLKGVARGAIVRKHALIQAVGPIANVVALNVAYMVSGVVVVETIFSYPGLARLMTDAVLSRDMPVIQACAMLFSAVYVILVLLADALAKAFDVRGPGRRGA